MVHFIVVSSAELNRVIGLRARDGHFRDALHETLRKAQQSLLMPSESTAFAEGVCHGLLDEDSE